MAEVVVRKSERCPMCEGRGGWTRESWQPTSNKHQEGNPEFVTCPFCRGSRVVVMPEWMHERPA